MKRRLFRSSIVAALSAGVLLGLVGSAFAYSNDFNTLGDTTDWNDTSGTITQRPSGFANPAYADGIASDGSHARLDRGACTFDDPQGGIGPSVNCSGPFTRWGGYGDTWHGPYQTQVDVYLDAAYANDPANEDSSVGNLDLIADPTNPDEIGTRFDYTSAINDNTGNHLRDFGFVVGTGQAGNTCAGWVINAQTNVNRNNAFPDDASKDPKCITGTGWYTFKHSFSENAALQPRGADGDHPRRQHTATASWTIEADPILDRGLQPVRLVLEPEIFGLPIDNPSMTGGCAEALHIGVIAPTATTCLQYRDNETTPVPVLDQVQYTAKSGKINAVSPGVFFYYTKVSGIAGDKVDVTQENDATSAPDIPFNQGQVVLYDSITCKVVRNWTPTVGTDGTATEPLPTGGNFILGVKYNSSALKGIAVPNPATVTYTFGAELNDVAIDEATVVLAPRKA